VTLAVSQGELERQVNVRSSDEMGQVGTALNNMIVQLRGLIGNLEQRVAERTRDMEQCSTYLQASADVGKVAASILDVDLLVQQVVDLIKERFDLYYVGLFQVNETGDWAMLRAGTGEAGKAMLARGFQVQIGGESMVGWCIANQQARILQDVTGDPIRLVIPELPDTRSEVAFPMQVHGEAIGALTIEDDKTGAFNQHLIDVLQAMVDQIAVALVNARLFRQAQESLEAERRAYGEISREAWSQIVRARSDVGYLCNPQGVQIIESQWQPEMLQASQSGQIIQDDTHTVAIPITVRDHVAGVIRLRKPENADRWTGEEIALMRTLTEQLGVALESARLYQDTQRHAAREQLTGEITTRMRETLDVDTVLQTAVREIGEKLDLSDLVIRIGSAADGQPDGNGGNS